MSELWPVSTSDNGILLLIAGFNPSELRSWRGPFGFRVDPGVFGFWGRLIGPWITRDSEEIRQYPDADQGTSAYSGAIPCASDRRDGRLHLARKLTLRWDWLTQVASAPRL